MRMNGYRRLFAPVFILGLAVAAVSTGGAQNPFAIQSIQPTTNGGIALTWSTLPGRSNQVTSTDSLSDEWQDLPDGSFVAGTNVYTLSYTDYPAADVTQRFYRIKTRTSPASLVMSLVLDRSGSMATDGGAAMLPTVISSFIDVFDDQLDHASVSSFASGSTVDLAMSQPFKQGVKNAATAIAQLCIYSETHGSADTFTCAERGLTNALAQNDTVTVQPGENVVKVIVFFTDGVANTWYCNFDCGPRDIDYNGNTHDPTTGASESCAGIPHTLPSIDPSTGVITPNAIVYNNCVDMHNEAQRRAERIAWLARSKGIYVFAIGMGSPASPGECSGQFPVLNPVFLKNLANTPDSVTYNPTQPSGCYAIAADPNGLPAVFQEIASKLLSQ